MNTVIVPVDFSATSLHAARYAAQLLKDHPEVTLLLYHSYSKLSEKADVEGNLEQLKSELVQDYNVHVELLPHHESDFIDGLEKAVRHRRADMVVMGTRGRSPLQQFLFGSNTIKMVETKACPVLMIPEEAAFTPIKNVMLTSDFKNSLNTTPSVPIKMFLDVFKPQLHIVNVDKDHYISLTEEYEKEKQDLKQLFAEYNPEFYFMRLFDVDEAINLFAEERNIDLIIVIQKSHSFIDKLFKNNRARVLSYHTKMPILVMHE